MKSSMFLLFVISFLLIPGQSFALSCVEPPPVDVAADEYDGVIIGSVNGVKSNGGSKELLVSVEKSFKGVNVDKITIYEDPTWGESQEGATYLFFLSKEKEKWLHPLCSPTTHNTDLADEHFADQKEIPLQAVESLNSDSDNTLASVMISALLLGILGTITWILWTKKTRSSDKIKRNAE